MNHGRLYQKLMMAFPAVRTSPREHAPREGPPAPVPGRGEAEAQEEAPGAEPQLLLHGREVPGLLQDHHRLQPRADRRAVRRLLHCALPAHGREGEAYRRMLLQAEAALKAPAVEMSGTLPQ